MGPWSKVKAASLQARFAADETAEEVN